MARKRNWDFPRSFFTSDIDFLVTIKKINYNKTSCLHWLSFSHKKYDTIFKIKTITSSKNKNFMYIFRYITKVHRWGNSGNSGRLYFGGSKITADGDCSHEIKRRLLLGRKLMTNLDSILKSRDITLSTKVRLVKAMVFPVVMYGCESWGIKKAECRRIDAFELWCWRRLLRVPWTARRSNQSILKELSAGCSLEGLMLKLKLQYFGYLMQRLDSLEKTLMLGGIGDRRRREDRGWGVWVASPIRWTWVYVNSGSWW